MNQSDYDEFVFVTTLELSRKGLAYCQEAVVLREIGERLRAKGLTVDLPTQQAVLRAWHGLFHDHKLSWGYNLDNPSWPFFHVPPEVREAEKRSAG